MSNQTKKRKTYFRNQYKKEMRENRLAYRARRDKRDVTKSTPKEQEIKNQTLTHKIAKQCAQQRGTSVRFMAKWLRVLKDRDRFIKESVTAICPHILEVNIEMDSFTKEWSVAQYIHKMETSYRSKEMLDEAGKMCAMIDIGARDVFGDRVVSYLVTNVKRLMLTAPIPMVDKQDLWAKHNKVLSTKHKEQNNK